MLGSLVNKQEQGARLKVQGRESNDIYAMGGN